MNTEAESRTSSMALPAHRSQSPLLASATTRPCLLPTEALLCSRRCLRYRPARPEPPPAVSLAPPPPTVHVCLLALPLSRGCVHAARLRAAEPPPLLYYGCWVRVIRVQDWGMADGKTGNEEDERLE